MTKRMNLVEKTNRNDLFSSHNLHRSKARNRKSSSGGSSTTASEAQKIQKSLLKTQQLLKNELNRVSNITNVIEEDGNILQQTMDEHKSLNTKKAQKALTSLERAQQHEQRLIYLSILFFGVTVFYIMWVRVFVKFDFISVIIDKIV